MESEDGKAADKAVKGLFWQLTGAVTRGKIPLELYSQGLIDSKTVDKVISPTQAEQYIGAKIVREIQGSIEF